MIKSLVFGLKFSRAGNLIAAKRYGEAFDLMNTILNGIGEKADKDTLFYLNIRLSIAALGAGKRDVCMQQTLIASNKIANLESINESEREYLQTFCGEILEDCGGRVGRESGLTENDMKNVRSRFLREFPLYVSVGRS